MPPAVPASDVAGSVTSPVVAVASTIPVAPPASGVLNHRPAYSRFDKKAALIAASLAEKDAQVKGDIDAIREKAKELEEMEKDLKKKKKEKDISKDLREGMSAGDVQRVKCMRIRYGEFAFNWAKYFAIIFLLMLVLASFLCAWYTPESTGPAGILLPLILCVVLSVIDTFYLHSLFRVAGEKWFERRTVTHHYDFKRFVDDKHNDLRADSLSLGKLLHDEPMYAEFEYHRTGRPVNLKVTTLTVSLELLSQITTGRNMDLGSEPLAAYERLRQSANSTHSVKYSRYLALYGINIAQDTAVLGFALYMQQREQRGDVLKAGFPLAPATNV